MLLTKYSKDKPIVLPLHPRTKKYIEKYDIILSENVVCIDPVGYFRNAFSIEELRYGTYRQGGLQKEAFFFEKYCITLRDDTEWVELFENGFNKLVGAEYATIVNAYSEKKNEQLDFSMDLYGNGAASGIIVDSLLRK